MLVASTFLLPNQRTPVLRPLDEMPLDSTEPRRSSAPPPSIDSALLHVKVLNVAYTLRLAFHTGNPERSLYAQGRFPRRDTVSMA